MENFKKLPLILLLFAVANIANANTEKPDALLHGYVTDAVTKKPVSGVTVSATAIGVVGFKEAITDADGYFSFVQLPAQQVNLQFGKKGYQNYKRSNITVKEKMPLKIAVEFFPEKLSDNLAETEYPLLRMLQLE
jgi:Carboxypeptidase regulatory-like domain